MLRSVPDLIWLLPAVFALIDWYAVSREDRRTETWAKPATLVALIVAALVLGAADDAAGGWLLVALVFGLAGDVFLLGKSDTRFRLGLAAFLVGHLAYVVCFAEAGLPRPAWAWLSLLVLAAAVVVTRDVVPATHRQVGPALSVPVAVYTAVIGIVLVLAWCTGLWLVALGATVFVASDTTLALDKFVRPLPHAQLTIMVTYHLGQALIVAGVLTR